MHRKQFWGCFYCKNRKNNTNHNRCNICGKERDIGRFVVKANNESFLCKVHLTWRVPTVSVFKLAATSKGGTDVQFSTSLVQTEFTLRDCVVQTVLNWIDEVESTETTDIDTQAQSEQAIVEQQSPDRSKSLFEQVLHNAQHKAYDANIGRYIDRNMVEEGRENVKIHLLYVEQLKHSEGEKRRLVRETKERASRKGQIFHHDADDPAPDEKQLPCTLCRINFFKSQMFAITNKRAEKWFLEHDVELDPLDRRFHSNYSHEPALVCLFCYQFFDDGSLNEAVASNIAIRSEIESVLNNSPLKLMTVDGGGIGSSSGSVDNRPLSAIAMDAALFKLKQKHDLTQMGLRFQRIEAHGIQKGGMLDQDRFGRFLRDKYATIKDVLVEAKKNELKAMKRSTRYKSAKFNAKGYQEGGESTSQLAAPSQYDLSAEKREIEDKVVKKAPDRNSELQTFLVDEVLVSNEDRYDTDDFEKDEDPPQSNFDSLSAIPESGPREQNVQIAPPIVSVPLKTDKERKAIARRCPLVLFVAPGVQQESSERSVADPVAAAPIRLELKSVRLQAELQKRNDSINNTETVARLLPNIRSKHEDIEQLSDKSSNANKSEHRVSKSLRHAGKSRRQKSNGRARKVTANLSQQKLPPIKEGIADKVSGTIDSNAGLSVPANSVVKSDGETYVGATESDRQEYDDDFETEYDDDQFEIEEDRKSEPLVQNGSSSPNQWLAIDISNIPSTGQDFFGLNMMAGQAFSGRAKSSDSRTEHGRASVGVEVLSPSMRDPSKSQKSPSKPRSVHGRTTEPRYFEKLEHDSNSTRIRLTENASSWFWDGDTTLSATEQETDISKKAVVVQSPVRLKTLRKPERGMRKRAIKQ